MSFLSCHFPSRFRRSSLLSGLILALILGCGHTAAPYAALPQIAGIKVMPPSRGGGSEQSAGVFRDVAHEAGLNFRWGHNGRSPLTITETLGHGTAFLDYDQDGLLDILLVGNRRLALYHNLGNGHFQDVTRQAGLTAEGDFYGVAVGDYDNDGYPDLFITGYGICLLYHNEIGKNVRASKHPYSPQPYFSDVTSAAGVQARGPYDCVTAAAFVDLDGDGNLDLFAGRYIVFKPDSIRFCFYQGIRAGCGVKNYNPDVPRVYRNNGNGTFTDKTKVWGFDKAHGRCLGAAVRAADEGNGAVLYIANDELPGDLFVPVRGKYINIGVKSGVAYNHEGLTQGGMGVDWGDYLNEGRPGLIVTTFQAEPDSLYRCEGQNLYREVGANLNIAAGTTAWVGWSAKFVDYDNDGWLDLIITNGHSQDNARQVEADRSYPQPMLLYHNERGNMFRDISSQGGPEFQKPFVGRGGSIGDFDNDGRMDLLLVDEEGNPKLLHNEVPSRNHWLGIRLIGVKSNRDGIGARVQVTAGGNITLRDQQLAGGYLSAHDPRLHFGLGLARSVTKIVVRWPDGHQDRMDGIAADRYIEIVEGKGITSRSIR